MYRTQRSPVLPLAAALACSLSILAATRAQNAGGPVRQPGQPAALGQTQPATQPATQPTTQPQAQVHAQAAPQIEQQRQRAEQQARQSLDPDAAAAIRETQNAIKAIEQGHTNDALAALERASGKINLLLGRNPASALIPVEYRVEVIDTAPTNLSAIRSIAKAAERAMDDRDYPQARALLQGLISEIRVRTFNLPLASYPEAMREAARLLDQKRNDEAKAVLQTALNTLVVVDRATPLPVLVAQAAIEQAQAERDRDRDRAQRLLAFARAELERARELGYAGKDPEYAALNQAISDIERQLKGKQDTGSAFQRLRERVASFFHRQSSSEKRAAVATR